MALTTVALKPSVFLTLDDAKDWLRIKPASSDNDPGLDNRLARLLNMAVDLCERYIDGPIMNRAIVEVRDGSSCNMIVPDYYPIKSVEKISVDYNGNFTPTTVLTPDNTALHAFQGITSVGVNGIDVVVRGQESEATFGQISMGAAIASIEIQYTAGWGATAEEIPYDLQHAVLLTLEVYYILRENRELNVRSKSAFQGQSYHRDTGLPKEVEIILDQYKDYSFGRNNQPQRNIEKL